MIRKRIPLKGTFELTGQCNMQCQMCYVRVNQQAIQASGKRERTAAEWISMAEQAAEAGTLHLLLTGGEITLRPDFPEIYEAIARMGFVTTFYTNATNVSDKLMALLERYPPHMIGVTMYGASPETYQAVCGHADGYERFVSGVRRLKTLPSVFDMRTTLVKANAADYPAMKDFTEQEFGADKVLHVSSVVYQAIRGGVGNPCGVRLSGRENTDLFCHWLLNLNDRIDAGELSPQHIFEGPAFLELEQKMKRHSLPPEGGYLFANCGAGLDTYHISWAGEMYACTMAAQGCTHPFEEGFRKAWEDLPEQYPLAASNPKCRSCSLEGYCQSCPAQRMAETGSWSGAPAYSCEAAKRTQEILEPLFIKANLHHGMNK